MQILRQRTLMKQHEIETLDGQSVPFFLLKNTVRRLIYSHNRLVDLHWWFRVKVLRQYLRDLRLLASKSFFFVHIFKTAGTSVERALDIPKVHLRLNEAEYIFTQLLREVDFWANSYKFSVVRNPWDLVVSQYAYEKQSNRSQLKMSKRSFEEWVKLVYEDRKIQYCDTPKFFSSQSSWLKDGRNKIALNKILRFENISEDSKELFDELGMIPVALPRAYVSNRRRNYKDYYNDETRKIVETFFREDCERFSYVF